VTYKTLISDTRLPQGNESIDLNLKQPTRTLRPLLHLVTASVAFFVRSHQGSETPSFNGITINPIGEDGVEPSASMSRHLSTTPTEDASSVRSYLVSYLVS